MRIAQLAPLQESVPPSGYGGTELVVSLLTEELIQGGHEVTLFASGDSETSANLISTVPKALRKDSNIPIRRWPAYEFESLLKLKAMKDQFDIIHNHMGFQAFPILEDIGLPFITTNHNPIKPYNAAIYQAYSSTNFVAISHSYRKLNLPEKLNYVATIYNGIDIDTYPLSNNSGSYLLFLGRVSQDKGTDKAIEIATKLKLPLKIAGKVDSSDRQYYQRYVKPALTNTDIEFVGEVNHEQKCQLFQDAIATVYPIGFDEPFGLVMVESLACGVPVMAFDRGSVKEILEDGEDAVIATSVDGLVERFEEVSNLSRQTCRNHVSTSFSKEKMTGAYEALYENLLGN
jgi:glycosyltransferase involved in cell wall biosynthesis